jgi:hypothetical protein
MYAPLFSVESQYFGAEKTNNNNKRKRLFPHRKERHEGLTGYALSVVLLFVSLHAHLVASDNCLQVVLVAELLGNVRPELHPNTTLAWASPWFLLRIGPEHLHHETRLTRLPLLVAVQLPDVVERHVIVREQAAVENEIVASDQGGEWKGREALREEFENSDNIRQPER